MPKSPLSGEQRHPYSHRSLRVVTGRDRLEQLPELLVAEVGGLQVDAVGIAVELGELGGGHVLAA